MSAYDISPWPCPYCQFPMEADYVDVGIGMQQCGPHHCDNCGASEIGPESGEIGFENTLSPDEKRTGFYRGGRISPHANQHNGKLISHKQADALYRAEYFALHGNPYNAPVIRGQPVIDAARKEAQP